MKLKKMFALVLAASMTMGMATTALADNPSGGTTGEGEVEFVYNENVFQVVLPTVSADDNTFDFKLDPQKVMYATKTESGITMAAEASLVFTNVAAGTDTIIGTDDDVVTYSNTSDAFKIINKSSFDVTVTVDAAIKGEDADAKKAAVTGEDSVEAKFVDTLTASSPSDAEIVLTLQNGDASKTDNIDGAAYTAQITFDISALADAYEVKYDGTKPEGQRYSYDLKSTLTDASFSAQTAEIKLTGECNDHANWAKLEDITPEVDVTWTVAPKSVTDYDDRNGPAAPVAAAPSIATTSYDMAAGTAIDITVDLGTDSLAATGLTSVTFQNYGGNTATGDFLSLCTFANNKLTIPSDIVDAILAQNVDSELTFTFNDDAATVVKVVLNNTSVTTEKDN